MPLITTATTSNALNASTSDVIPVATQTGGVAYLYDTDATTGNDTLTLRKSDSLLTTRKIFDSNDDNILNFNSKTDTLQSDRTDGFEYNQNDTIKFTNIDGAAGLRYLGERDGYNVYADFTVRTSLAKSGLKVREGSVNNDTIVGSGVADGFLYDTALGLNLGNDTITNFAANDRLVTTTKIFDANNDGKIGFAGNKAVDLPGDVGSEGSNGNEFGGIVSITDTSGKAVTALYLISDEVIDGVHFFYYGSTPTV